MNEDNLIIFGYLDLVKDVAYCPTCTEYLFDVLYGLGHGVLRSLHHKDAEDLNGVLHCVECGKELLVPVPSNRRLNWWRKVLKEVDLE